MLLQCCLETVAIEVSKKIRWSLDLIMVMKILITHTTRVSFGPGQMSAMGIVLG